MKRIFITLAFFAALAAAAVCSCSTANAQLNIVPVWDSSVTSNPNAATIESTIDAAISNIDGDIANSETVYIAFSATDNALGESATKQYSVYYGDYLNALETNQTLSSQDTTALASLGQSAPYTSNPETTTNPVNGGVKINAQAPLLLALGLTTAVSGAAITPSSSSSPASTISFYDNSGGDIVDYSTGTPPEDEVSLESVVAHEMDEVLGIGGGGSQLNNLSKGKITATGAVGPTDLYRYSSPGVRSYTTSDDAPDPYFSIDGGNTNIVYFSQNGASTGADFGDWGNGSTGSLYGNTPPQVQDAYATSGTYYGLGSSEMTALDVVGWNLASQGHAIETGAVPEPAAYASILLGGLMLAGLRRLKTG